VKHCRKCDSTKPEAEFHKDRRRADGLSFYCADCKRANTRHWGKRNAPYARARAREYRDAHLAEARERSRRWAVANPDKAAEGKRRAKHRFRQTQRALYLARKRLEMARRRFTAETAKYAALIAHDPCAYCGEPGGTIDHIEPLVNGGANHWSNLTGACFSCNARKQRRPLLAALLDIQTERQPA